MKFTIICVPLLAWGIFESSAIGPDYDYAEHPHVYERILPRYAPRGGRFGSTPAFLTFRKSLLPASELTPRWQDDAPTLEPPTTPASETTTDAPPADETTIAAPPGAVIARAPPGAAPEGYDQSEESTQEMLELILGTVEEVSEFFSEPIPEVVKLVMQWLGKMFCFVINHLLSLCVLNICSCSKA